MLSNNQSRARMAKYYRYLNQNPHFRLKEDFSRLIKRAVREGRPFVYKTPLRLGGIEYSVCFHPLIMILEINWMEEDELRIEAISVIKERSNLSSCSGSYVYYFLCPLTGMKCRKLYKIGFRFMSRRAFRAVYPQQMESRTYRSICYMESPYKKYGKEYYRGQLTPYGKRCIRFEEQENRWIEAANRMLGKFDNTNSK